MVTYNKNIILTDFSFIIWGLLLLGFLFQTFNQTLAILYFIFIVMYFVATVAGGSKLRYQLNSIRNNTTKSWIMAIIFFVVFMFISAGISGLFQNYFTSTQGGMFSLVRLQSIVRAFSTTTPLLQGSKWVTLGVFGVLIPLIETSVLARIIDSLSLKTKLTLNLAKQQGLVTWGILILAGVLSAIFHVQAKSFAGVIDSVAIMMVFLFFVISGAMVIKYKEYESAIYFHVLANSITILITYFI